MYTTILSGVYVFDLLNPFNDISVPDGWGIFNEHYVHFEVNDFNILRKAIDNEYNITLMEVQKYLCQTK
jgi:hypothetical protein